MDSPTGSRKRIHNRWSATKSTTPMKIRSNALVSIGRKPRRRGIVGSTGAATATSGGSSMGSALDGAEGEAGDDVALGETEEEQRRQQRQGGRGGHLTPVRAGDRHEFREPGGDGPRLHAGERR